MKFSELARTYERISEAKGEQARVRLLADVFRKADRATLEAAAHFTLSEVVDPQLSDRLSTGPGTIRTVLARMFHLEAAEIDEEVKRTGDMSEVVAAHVRGTDSLTVAKLWQRMNRAVRGDEDRAALVEYVFRNTKPLGAKFFTRMLLNQMRIGAGLGTTARALASAFGVDAAQVEHLYAMT
nr:hypothetical protein [Acidobacteriota bacterium]